MVLLLLEFGPPNLLHELSSFGMDRPPVLISFLLPEDVAGKLFVLLCPLGGRSIVFIIEEDMSGFGLSILVCESSYFSISMRIFPCSPSLSSVTCVPVLEPVFDRLTS